MVVQVLVRRCEIVCQVTEEWLAQEMRTRIACCEEDDRLAVVGLFLRDNAASVTDLLIAAGHANPALMCAIVMSVFDAQCTEELAQFTAEWEARESDDFTLSNRLVQAVAEEELQYWWGWLLTGGPAEGDA